MKTKLFLLLFGFIYLHAENFLVIQDQSDYIVIVSKPVLHYSHPNTSSLNFFHKADKELDGIRVSQGMGQTLILWEDIKNLHFKHTDEQTSLNIELIKDSQKLSLKAIPIHSGFKATSGIGQFSIDFKNIKTIHRVTKNNFNGYAIAISRYLDIPKSPLPKNIDITNDTQLIAFTSKQIGYEENRLAVKRVGQYIIIHFEDEKYIKKHPKWETRKYGESVVIDKSTQQYVRFRLSKT